MRNRRQREAAARAAMALPPTPERGQHSPIETAGRPAGGKAARAFRALDILGTALSRRN
jgi:hypothetical protein